MAPGLPSSTANVARVETSASGLITSETARKRVIIFAGVISAQAYPRKRLSKNRTWGLSGRYFATDSYDGPFEAIEVPTSSVELCGNLGDAARSGGVVYRRFEDLDAVFESDTCDKIGRAHV